MAIFDPMTTRPHTPSVAEQKSVDKQLLVEAPWFEEAGFKEIGLPPVAQAAYIG